MAEARPLALADLRDIVLDPAELAKGAKLVDDKGLAHLARFQNKLYADARGSGFVPYKVQITLEPSVVRARCSCMAARTRPFCKHAAGLLVAWARAPESFAESASAPEADPTAKKRAVKQGKVTAADLMARGLEQASTLVRELAVSGVTSVAEDRVDQVKALSEALREAKLRRVAGRTRALSEQLARAAARSGAFDPAEYAEIVGDILLTVRKLEKHLAGEPLAEEHVEELIGKTWTKRDRRPVAGLDLVEYAFVSKTTPEEFVIRESRFLDLASGDHYSEKQILPGFLVRRSIPKKSYRGRRLRDVSGTLFPSYAPRRVDLEQVGATDPLGGEALDRMLALALPDARAVIDALQARRRDVFAPPLMPVAMRAASILAEGPRLRVVDPSGASLFLPDDADLEESLARLLRGRRVAALLGDVALDGALATLFPLALLLSDHRGGLALEALGGIDAAALLATRKIRREALLATRSSGSRWSDVARESGVGAAAVVLGEVREELGAALANGVSTVVPRLADPLAARLAELGLAKPAELLRAVAAANDPFEKVDDVVKLHQVLAVALTRIAAATQADLEGFESVPTHESVLVRRVREPLPPKEALALRGAGKLNRYQAIVHYARHYAGREPAELVRDVYPLWADGGAASFVARAATSVPAEAVAAARRVLGLDDPSPRTEDAPEVDRVARRTAIFVLELAPLDAAEAALAELVKKERDPTLIAYAQASLARRRGDRSPRAPVDEVTYRALHSASKDARIAALETLAAGAHTSAIPVVRASFAGDVSAEVREAAALALARMGDVDAFDTFATMLRSRLVDPTRAKLGARALGVLGDARAADDLVRALEEGFQPQLVAEALRGLGPSAVPPLLSAVVRTPALADRSPAQSVLAAARPGLLLPRVEAHLGEPESDEFVLRASALLAALSKNETAARALADLVLAKRPSIREKGATPAERSLAKRCAKLAS